MSIQHGRLIQRFTAHRTLTETIFNKFYLLTGQLLDDDNVAGEKDKFKISTLTTN